MIQKVREAKFGAENGQLSTRTWNHAAVIVDNMRTSTNYFKKAILRTSENTYKAVVHAGKPEEKRKTKKHANKMHALWNKTQTFMRPGIHAEIQRQTVKKIGNIDILKESGSCRVEVQLQ